MILSIKLIGIHLGCIETSQHPAQASAASAFISPLLVALTSIFLRNAGPRFSRKTGRLLWSTTDALGSGFPSLGPGVDWLVCSRLSIQVGSLREGVTNRKRVEELCILN